MIKLLFVLTILVLVFYLVRMAFKLGESKGKEKPVSPDLDTSKDINDRIKALLDEIDYLEKSMPKDIEEHKQKLFNMQNELERLQKLKVKFSDN